MRRAIKVSELCAYLERTILTDPILQSIKIEGQIVNVSKSRYLYFDLIDEGGLIHCVSFDPDFDRESVEDGRKVIIEGSMILYKAGGRYQIKVSRIVDGGKSKELIELYELKKRLEKEGLFDLSRKKPLPKFPSKLVFISSGYGAVIHDFSNEIKKRWPILEIIFISAPVQGVYAADKIREALEFTEINYKNQVDLIVIARGGGSDRDLSTFNDESLVRAVANCSLPVISAIGHQVDNSLCDLAADARASTPTEAAILASPDMNQIKMYIDERVESMFGTVKMQIDSMRLRAHRLTRTISQEHPLFKISGKRESLKRVFDETRESLQGNIFKQRNRLKLYIKAIERDFEKNITNIKTKEEVGPEWSIYDSDNNKILKEAGLEVGKLYDLKTSSYFYKIKVEEKVKNEPR